MKDALDYLLPIAVVLISIYFIVKYVLQVIQYMNLRREYAEIIKPKIDRSAYLFGPYSYVVKYSVDGEIFESSLKGYTNPFEFEPSTRVVIYFDEINPKQVFSGELKGRKLNILFKLSVVILLISSAVSSLQSLGTVSFEYTVLTPLAFLFLAVIMLTSLLNARYILKKRSACVKGVIKDFSKFSDFENQVAYRPIVEFVNNDSVIRFESELAFYNTFKLGKTVSVRYVLDHPEFSEITSFWSAWLKEIFFFILILISCAVLYSML